ncbi:MAG: sulfite exporter TauE/SafE family protein [Ruminococcaceae bacterium]|nr:sulfite exporter TauE/SafE family protein [Oscillospiraceae bacterium]
MLKKSLLLAGGVCAGFINGLLGTGGGIIIIFVLNKINEKNDPKDNFASAVAAILPMSLVSAASYLKNGGFDISELGIYVIPAVLGGLSGAFLLCKIKITFLKRIFAGIITYAGINMLFF